MEEFSEFSIARDQIDHIPSEDFMASRGAYHSVGTGGEQLQNANALLTFGEQQNLLTSNIEFGAGVGLFRLDEFNRHSAPVISHINRKTNSMTG